MTIAAIALDADGVLQYPAAPLTERAQKALGFAPQPLEAFVAEVFAAEKPALSGQADLIALLDPVLHKWGAPGKGQALIEHFWYAITVDHEILKLVGELRDGGYRCALATNQHRYRARFMALELGYSQVFDRCVFSCEVGAAKPSGTYFAALTARLGVAAHEVLFVDDGEHNVTAARVAGLQAARFVHPRRPGASGGLRALLERHGVLAA